jgi:hypothetical protein
VKLSDDMLTMLRDSGLDWSLESGRKHFKLKVSGFLVGVTPPGNPRDRRRGLMETSLRRFLRNRSADGLRAQPHTAAPCKLKKGISTMKLEGMIHDNARVVVVVDPWIDSPSEWLEIDGVLTEDAESLNLQGDRATKVVAQCGDLSVIGCLPGAQPKEVIAPFKKGVRVHLAGHFTPTKFERHKDGILKPFCGMMVVKTLEIAMGERGKHHER